MKDGLTELGSFFLSFGTDAVAGGPDDDPPGRGRRSGRRFGRILRQLPARPGHAGGPRPANGRPALERQPPTGRTRLGRPTLKEPRPATTTTTTTTTTSTTTEINERIRVANVVPPFRRLKERVTDLPIDCA